MSRELAGMGCDIMTGGGPDLTQAANEGTQEAAAAGLFQNIGIRVDLPFEQAVNPFVGQSFKHETFFTRLHRFVLMSDAFIVAPGGIGAVLESTMIWQPLQVRHLQDTPLIFAGSMWKDLVDWSSEWMLRPGFELANPEDIKIPRCVDTADEAIALIREHHTRWLARQTAGTGAA